MIRSPRHEADPNSPVAKRVRRMTRLYASAFRRRPDRLARQTIFILATTLWEQKKDITNPAFTFLLLPLVEERETRRSPTPLRQRVIARSVSRTFGRLRLVVPRARKIIYIADFLKAWRCPFKPWC